MFGLHGRVMAQQYEAQIEELEANNALLEGKLAKAEQEKLNLAAELEVTMALRTGRASVAEETAGSLQYVQRTRCPLSPRKRVAKVLRRTFGRGSGCWLIRALRINMKRENHCNYDIELIFLFMNGHGKHESVKSSQ